MIYRRISGQSVTKHHIQPITLSEQFKLLEWLKTQYPTIMWLILACVSTSCSTLSKDDWVCQDTWSGVVCKHKEINNAK